MAVSDTTSPFIKMIDSLISELGVFPERRDEIILKYKRKSVELMLAERKKGANFYLWECIDALYDKEEEQIRKADRARLALGGVVQVPNVKIAGKERLALADYLIQNFRKRFQDDPFS